jgi:hypothetical protein
MRPGVRQRLVSLRHAVQAAWSQWSGEEEYARYVERCAMQQVAPLDRGRYFAQVLEERYTRAGRCC